jgi:hypothetical protein
MFRTRQTKGLGGLRVLRARRVMIPVVAVASLLGGSFTASSAFAQGNGGTAKPPTKGVISPFITPTLSDPLFSASVVNPLTGLPSGLHGFDDTGFLKNATVSGAACPGTPAANFGGSVTLNGINITVPCNMVIQLPANTLTWADFINGGTLPDPSMEIHAVGNILGDAPSSPHIAGLMYASQQSANVANGVISKIDYTNGNIQVDTGTATPVNVQINDPKGRYGRAQSPDARFSVDDANPTIHAGTGYPMCVPRTDPASADDPLCPQQNRPKSANGTPCRNFSAAGVVPLPKGGELSATPFGLYCTQFVMPAPPAAGIATTGMDARQQAPFEVGDRITFSGTLMGTGASAYISAHTIEANVGIFTQPKTQPGYVAIGDFGVGSADPNAVAVTGVAQEQADRIFLEAETTDVLTPVDIYMMDVDPQSGVVRNRWVTPFEMTGENQLGVPPGGITTQFTGVQSQRIRIRTPKAPLGLLSQPTRDVRVVQRSLCTPQFTSDQPLLDACLANAPVVANGLVAGQYYAPTFQFIFPENVKPGDAPVPNDLWHLPFLRFGEGATTASAVGPSVGALIPAPW